MHILAIETTGPFCSAALQVNGELIVEKRSETELDHLTNLVPMIKDILGTNKIEISDIDVIAVSAGPGSFTGIRIGISTARAISQMTGISVVSIASLDAIYRANMTKADYVCTLLDARRGSCYTSLYTGRKAECESDDSEKGLTSEKALIKNDTEDLKELLDDIIELAEAGKISRGVSLLFVGDGVEAYGEELKEFESRCNACDIEILTETDYPTAAAVAELAYEGLMSGSLEKLKYRELLPNYMRKPAAQTKLEESCSRE